MKSDICIIGAGPAGLFAAIWAAQNGADVLIIERNTSAGRKLLRTGRGRCNITHSGSITDFIKAYGRGGRFLRHSLYEFSADDLRKYFAARGLKTKVEKDGCVFPVTDRATDVAQILLKEANESEVRFMYGKSVREIQKQRDGFEIVTDRDSVEAKIVIITTGGSSWAFTGSTGDGYKFAKALGHTIIESKAALCPLVTAEKWPGKLQGIAVPDVIIETKVSNHKFKVRGPLMFTGNGIGGPAVFDISRLVADYLPDYENPLVMKIDFLPGYDLPQLDRELVDICAQHPKKSIASVISDFVRKSLAEKICEQMKFSNALTAGQFSKVQRKDLIHTLKGLVLSIVSTAPIEQATITKGGISADEIEWKTMQSKICEGLYFAGEVMDVDGPCGGYNLQIAFSTGRLAGLSAANNLR
jgi:hypothetical protein